MEWGPNLAKLKCPICRSGFPAEQVSLIRELDQELYVRCVCLNCNSVSAAVFVHAKTVHPITEEDVIAAYEFLEQYRGNVDGLFSAT